MDLLQTTEQVGLFLKEAQLIESEARDIIYELNKLNTL